MKSPRDHRPGTKIERIAAALRGRSGLNRIEAEALHDHCLPSTVFALRRAGETVVGIPETVPTRFGRTRFMRYKLINKPKGK